MKLRFRRDFWALPLTWGRVPLIISNNDGWTLRLCDDCTAK